MAEQQVKKGISGVLAGLVTPQSMPAPPASSEPHPVREEEPLTTVPAPPVQETQEVIPKKQVPDEKTKARRGRPLAGSRTSEPVEREKVSLRLRSDLAAAYRDWSWEERCQFSDLVDRALESYLKNRQKARKP